jgi:hypothetical protein
MTPREEGYGLQQLIGSVVLLAGLAGTGYIVFQFFGLFFEPSNSALVAWLIPKKPEDMAVLWGSQKIVFPVGVWKLLSVLLSIFLLSGVGSIAVGVLKSGVDMLAMDYRKMLKRLYDGLMDVRGDSLAEKFKENSERVFQNDSNRP